MYYKHKYFFYFVISSLCITYNFQAFSLEKKVGKIENIIGEAELVSNNKTIHVAKNLVLHLSDTLRTKQNALVKIKFFDGSNIVLYEQSELKIKEYNTKLDAKKTKLSSVFENIKGKIRFFVKPDGNAKEVSYKTSNAVMLVRGTQGFIITPKVATTQLAVISGIVDLSNAAHPDQFVQVKKNEWGQIDDNNPPQPPQPVTPELLDALKVNLPTGFE